MATVSPSDVVVSFFERMEARDWPGARLRVATDVHIHYSATGERFDGPAFVDMNEAYPEGWTIEVVEVIGLDDRVAAQVRVDHGAETFWCAGFYTVADDVIVDGVEHWVTAGGDEAPDWRSRFTTPT